MFKDETKHEACINALDSYEDLFTGYFYGKHSMQKITIFQYGKFKRFFDIQNSFSDIRNSLSDIGKSALISDI